MKDSIFSWHRILALCILLVQVTMMVPAQELYLGKQLGNRYLEQYLDRADMESSQQRWQELADQGMLVALAAWESSQTYLWEQDPQAWQAERDLLEQELTEQREVRLAQWILDKYIQSQSNPKFQQLATELEQRAAQWQFQQTDETGTLVATRQVDADDSQEAKAQWLASNQQLIRQYLDENALSASLLEGQLQELNLDEATGEVLAQQAATSYRAYLATEYDLILRSETMDLLGNLLYDRESLRAASAKESADNIALTLIQEAKASTDIAVKELFQDFQADVAENQLEEGEILVAGEQWAKEFQRQLEEGLAVWDKVEVEFLSHRSQWEQEALETYEAGEEAWLEAFQKLQSARQDWENEIMEEFQRGMEEWSQSQLEQELEIQSAQEELVLSLQEEIQRKEELAVIAVNVYNQMRSLLASCYQGVENWYSNWTQKYNKVYSYWKSEDASGYDNRFSLGELEGLDEALARDSNASGEIDLEQLSASDTRKKLDGQINQWKEAYLAQIKNEVEKEILQLESKIEKNEANLESLQESIKKSTGTQNIFVTLEEIQNLEEQLEADSNRKSLLQELLVELDTLDISMSGSEIASALTTAISTGLLKTNFDAKLWDSSEILLHETTGWLVLAEAGFENLAVATNNFLEAVDPTSLEGSSSDLDAEIQRLENTLSYWQDELAVAQALKEYATTTSSSAETAQETQQSLEEKQGAFQQASESYENYQQLVQEAQSAIQQAMIQLSEVQQQLDAVDSQVEEIKTKIIALEEVEAGLNKEVLEAQLVKTLGNLGKTLQADELVNLVESYFHSEIDLGNYIYTNTIEELLSLIPRKFTDMDEDDLAAEIQSYTEVIAELKTIATSLNNAQTNDQSTSADPLAETPQEENSQDAMSDTSADNPPEQEIVISQKSQDFLTLLAIDFTSQNVQNIILELESIAGEYEDELLYRQEATAYLTTGEPESWKNPATSQEEENRRQLIHDSFSNFQVEFLNEKHRQGIQEIKEILDKNKTIWDNTTWDIVVTVVEQVHDAGSKLHTGSVSAVNELIHCIIQNWCLQNPVTEAAQKAESQNDSPESTISSEQAVSRNQLQQQITELQTLEAGLFDIHEIFNFMNSSQFFQWDEESQDTFTSYVLELILSTTNSTENLPITDGIAFFQQLDDGCNWKKDFFQLSPEMQQLLAEKLQSMAEQDALNENLSIVQSIVQRKKSELEKEDFLLEIEELKKIYLSNSTWLDVAAGLNNCTQIDGSKLLSPEDWVVVQALLAKDGLYTSKLNQLQTLGKKWITMITNSQDGPYKIMSQDEIQQMQKANSQYLEKKNSLLETSSSLEKELLQSMEIYQLVDKNTQELTQEKESLENLVKQEEANRQELVNQYAMAREEVNESLETYQLKIVEEENLYQSLLQSRLELRIAEEKYQWASRIYLESMGSQETQGESQYESPLQRYNQVLLVTNRYQKALDVLVQMKNQQQLQRQDYLAEVEAYEAALENVYLIEVILSQALTAVAKQEVATQEAELQDDINASKLFSDYESLYGSLGATDTNGINSPALELIRIGRDEDGSYFFSLGYETNYVKAATRTYTDTDGNEVSYDVYDYVTSAKKNSGNLDKKLLESYVMDSTESIIRVKENLQLTSAEVEVRQWLEKIYAMGDDYLNKLLLASIHLKTYYSNAQEFLDGQADIRENNSFQADQIPSLPSFHGIDVLSSYKNERQDVVADAYNFIMSQEGGQEDLARYILYRETNLLDKNSWQARELNVIEWLALDNVREMLADKQDQKNNEATIAFASAAALSVAAFFQSWLWVAVAAATAVGITASDAATSIGAAKTGINDLMQGNKENVLAESQRVNELLEKLEEGKQHLQEQWELLNFLYYGDASENSSEKVSFEDGQQNSLTSQSILDALQVMLDSSSLVSCQEYQELLSRGLLDSLLRAFPADTESPAKVTDILQLASTQFLEVFGEATGNLAQISADVQGQVQTAMTGFYEVLGQSMEISQEDKEQLALLEAQSTDESLSSAQRQLAMTEYESLYQSLHAVDSSFVNQLSNFASLAYGSEGWNNLLYKENIYNKMKSLYNTRIDLTSSTEEYTAWLQNLMMQQANASWADSCQQVLGQAQHQWQLELDLLNRRQSLWEGEVMATLAAGEKSWQRVEEQLNKEYNLWRRNFQQELEERQSKWDVNYLDFLQKKEAWIQESHREGVVQGLGQDMMSGSSLVSAINQNELESQLAQLGRNMESSVSQEMTEFVVESLLADSYLDQLMNRSLVMVGLGSNAGAGIKKIRRNTASLESHLAAQEQVAKTSQLMKDVAGRQAVDYGQNLLEQLLASYMEGIASQNKFMVDWQETLARDAGYTVDGSIRRTIVVDATLLNPIKETQTLPVYQHFSVAAPELRKVGATSHENAMLQLGLAQSELEQWGQSIFGDEGLLSKHIGVAPTVVDVPDATGSKNSAFKDLGSGQRGEILVDYHWNSIQARKGMEELSKAGHDKRLFDDRSLPFSAPTLREVAEVAMTVVGSATGQKWWFEYIDDAIFAAIDLGGGYKTAGEIGRELAIKAVGEAVGAGTKWAGDALSGIKNTAGKVAAMTGLNLVSGSVSNVATVTLQSMNFDKIGTGDFFNGEMFTTMISDKKSWASIVAGAASTGVSVYGGNFFGSMGAEANKFYGGAMNLATSVASQAASYGVYAAFYGGDWAEAYDAMGGINVNVANFAAIADFIGSGIARNNSTGQNILGKVIDKLDGKGIMLNLGLDGVSASVGSGGIDLSGNLYDLGKRAIDKRALESYAQSHGKELSDTVWNNYVYGDWTQENTSARLASGLDQLELIEQADFTALTTSNGASGRLIQMVASGNSYNNAIALGHESYRDGIIGTTSQQSSETLAATTAHTQMALRILDDGKKDQIQMTENLAMDIIAYQFSQGLGDETVFSNYVAGNYDSSGDYWLFKLDGSIEDTAEKAMYKEYVDKNGIVRRKKIEGSEYTGSRIKALVEVIGIENVKHMLSSNPKSIQDIPDHVLQSSFGWDEKMIADFKSNPIFINIGDQLLQSDEVYNLILGEMLMYENGGTWNSQTGIWNTGELKIPGLGSNDSLGITVQDDGSYQFFSAGLIFTREADAFEIYKNGKIGDSDTTYEQRDNTRISAWKRDLFTGETWSVEFENAATSIDRKSKTSVMVDGDVYTGNTLVSDYFKMRLIDSSNYNLSEYGVNQVGIFTDAVTLSGNVLNKAGYDGVTPGRYLYHPFGSGAGSEGCFGPMSDYGVSGYNNPNVSGTGAWHFQQQLDLFKEWGIYNGYEFNIQLTGKVRP